MKFNMQPKFRNVCLALACTAALWSGAVQAASSTLPAGSIKFSVVAGTNSYAPVTLSQVPGGHAVDNSTYQGWCVQYHVLIDKGPVFDGTLYDPYATLPGHLQGVAWDKINYIVNHKQGDSQEVQNAIWVTLGQSFDGVWTANSQAMVDAANQFGSGFVPAVGQYKAVIVDPQQVVQRLVCEVLVISPVQPVGTFTLHAARSGNSMLCTLEGPAGSYVIERSLDLVSWQSTMTVQIVSGSVSFSDSDTNGSTKYFYRARQN